MYNTWHGYRKEEFVFEEREAIIVFPDKPNKKRNWAIKMEYWDAFPDAEIEFLKKGFHILYLKNFSRFAGVDDCEIKSRFIQYVCKKYELCDKGVFVGMSLGGAHSVNFAGMFPEVVSALFLDAPVLNFCMYWLDKNNSIWENEFEATYPGVRKHQLLKFDNHPMNKLDVLLSNNIPVVMLYGTEDMTVDYQNNGKLLETAYSSRADLLEIIPRYNQGHHPHGLLNNSERVVDKVLAIMK